MAETAQQYTARIIGNLGGQTPLKILAATPKRLERLVKGVSPAKLKKRPAPGKWSVGEIVAHLADVEIAVGWRVRLILGSPGTHVGAYDQDAWAEAGHYAKRSVSAGLAQHSAVRKANLALFKLLTPQQWKHYGIHAERGQESVEHMTRMLAGHDLNHLRQIESIVGSKTPGEKRQK